MKKTESLVHSRNFKKIYAKGKNILDSFIVIYYIRNNLDINRLGIVVNKKVGKAVIRNKVRRLIKENFRLIENELKTGYDIVIVSRVKASKADYYDIKNSIYKLLNKAKLFNKERDLDWKNYLY